MFLLRASVAEKAAADLRGRKELAREHSEARFWRSRHFVDLEPKARKFQGFVGFGCLFRGSQIARICRIFRIQFVVDIFAQALFLF